MSDAPLALAFTAGMLAVLNPCGFAMLPAYLSFFLVGDGDNNREGNGDAVAGVHRGVVVAVSVSAGFALLFAMVGLAVRHLTASVLDYSPWVSVVIGIALALFGVALVAGKHPKIRVPGVGGGSSRTARSMVLYGASYGVVSLGCTLPTFLVYVAGTLTTDSFLAGSAVFVAYTAGFTVLLTGLTLALALARRSMLGGLKRTMPYVERGSGVLLVLAGAYVSYYGWYELHRFGEADPIIESITGLSADLQRFVVDIGATALALVLLILIAGCTAWAWSRPSRRDTQ